MKKVFFWTNYYIEQKDVGTTVKIRNEISTMRKMGYIVFYTAYRKNGVAIFDNCDDVVCSIEFDNNDSFVSSITRKDYLVRITRDFITSNTFDYFLLRINYFSRSYMRMLEKMKSQGSMIMMETLSYFPGIKYSIVKAPKLFAVAHSMKRNQKRIRQVVDLMLTEGKIESYYGVPCIEFGMGVNVEEFTKHQYKGNTDELNLIMVGCTSVYHGTDRVIRSLAKYYENNIHQKVTLHLVGDVLEKDKLLINQLQISDHVIMYGRRSGTELGEIYDECNVALGPLSQHRMNKKDTGLKTKEYFAKGIPYVYSGDEPCLEDDYPYVLQIPNDESLISIHEILSFYSSFKNDEFVAEKMRTKAKEIFSWEKLFEHAFFELNVLKDKEN